MCFKSGHSMGLTFLLLKKTHSMSKYSGSCEWTPAQTILVIHIFTVPAMISW